MIIEKAKGLVKKLESLTSNPASLEALASGVYHYKFKNADIEKLKDERAKICAGCRYRVDDDFEPIQDDDERISGKMCGSCFCSLPYLLRQTKKGCKERRWN